MSLRYTSILTLLCWLLTPMLVGAQGVTTASISGRILDTSNEPLIGATVVAVHQPTGTIYGNATDLDGYYRLANMRVGGPYTVTISYTGYGSQEFTGIELRLGENRTFDATLQDNTSELTEVVVTARGGSAGENAGASTRISTEQIEALPTINRDLSDFTRLTPQASSTGDGTSFAGVNNRYNAVYIDGAVNNDVFGLSSAGTNGGQTGASPFSIDIIDQIQVVLSPYDVSLGGFAGGGINAVTKSGTNQFKGTAYYFLQNQGLAGKTNGRLADRLGDDFERRKLSDFKKETYGASFGGPILRDKIFFFANVEAQKDGSPQPFEFGQYEGTSKAADIETLRTTLRDKYGYDAGTFGSVTDELTSLKLFGKLDFNLNSNNRLTLRHNYAKAENFDFNSGNSRTINFSNNGVYFPSTTNSSALELNSSFGTGASNNLILGYTRVFDDRDPIGALFPSVTIFDGSGQIRFGSEAFSAANQLKVNTFTITDNFKLYRGAHTITLGTHNEFNSFVNLFIPNAGGTYQFGSLQTFLEEGPSSRYDRSYSRVDNVIGDGSSSAAEFKAIQLGVYGQDEFVATDKLTLTAGLRIDVPIITSDPRAIDNFETGLKPQLAAAYPVAGKARAGQAPDGQVMFSPRVGFNYNTKNDYRMVVRGGAGIFTSRVPFVWPGGMFTNNGVTLGQIQQRGGANAFAFNPDVNQQYATPGDAPQGQIDLFVEDFKYPQVFRTNLAGDLTLPGGIDFTVEGLFSKTLNNIVVYNVNSSPVLNDVRNAAQAASSFPDDRTIYEGALVTSDAGGDVYVVDNTSKGYTYTLTTSVAKRFASGITASLAYTYGDAYSINDGTSSQNSSQWRGQINVDGRNNPVYGRSDYATGHRVVGALAYRADWTKDDRFATTVSLFFNGQTGSPYSYVIGQGTLLSRNANGTVRTSTVFSDNINADRGSTTRNRSLIYVPASQAQINLVDTKDADGNVVLTADQQWALLNAFISDDKYLSKNRGQYADKNSNFAPFVGIFDFAIRQNIGFEVGGRVQRLQASFDVFNFANFLNKNWGVRYNVPGDFNNYDFYRYVGLVNNEPAYNFTQTTTGKDALNISGGGSIWRARVGLRYLFN